VLANSINFNVAKKIATIDSTGTLEKALEGNLLKVKHDRPMVPPAAGLDLPLGEVLGDPSKGGSVSKK